MKKILFILIDLTGGGAERVIVNIANGFRENGIQVEFLLGRKTGVYLNLLHPEIPITEVGGTTFYKYLKTFPAIFKQNRYTHIFTASDYASTAAIIAKRLTGVDAKIYVTHHYNLPANRQLKHWKGDLSMKSMHRFVFPLADKIIAVSEGCLTWLKNSSRNKLKQGIVIYNPVFDDSIYSLAKAGIVYPVSVSGKTILLNVGRLQEQKDQLTLLKAFAILNKQHPDFLLFILGEGPLQQSLQDFIDVNNLRENVYLVGFDSNPYKWMYHCNVFVSSSISEGFGNVLAEAMALGKTIVSTNCPTGPREILQDGSLGYLCPVGDPPALAAAILQAANNQYDKEVLMKSSRQYTINTIVQKYLEIL